MARVSARTRSGRRAASPIIAAVFLVGMTIVAGTVLWSFRLNLPSAPVQIWYQAVSPSPTQAYADGSDCKNVGPPMNQTQVWEPLTGIDIVVTHFQPSAMPLASLQLYFLCQGTVYLSGTVASLAWVPGNTGIIGGGPGSGVPALGMCGDYTPPSAAFNRFMFFEQVTPGDSNLQAGDQFVIFAQGFSPPYCAFAPSTSNICWLTASQEAVVQASTAFPSSCPNPAYAAGDHPAANGSYGLNACDDDYHGVPTPQCYTVAGACTLDVVDLGQQSSLALSVSMVNLFAPNPA